MRAGLGAPSAFLTAGWADDTIPAMFRKRNRQAAPPEAQEVPQAPAPSGTYEAYELTTFDGRGRPTVIVYTRDAEGRTVKTTKRVRKA